MNTPDYAIELWDIDGIFIADVSNMVVGGFAYTAKRNDIEALTFKLDLVQYQKLLDTIGATAENVLEPYVTDVKVKRNGQYLFGTQVVEVSYNFDSVDASVDVKCDGYLNYFKDRYISAVDFPGVFNNKTYAQIAWNLIDKTQAQTNGDFGVTLGADTASAGQSSTRTRQADYDNQEVKNGIINLTNLENDNFDFYFTHDKKLYLTPRQGDDKPHIIFTYPDTIASMTVRRDASTIANKIIGIGSGMGEERLTATSGDLTSQITYKVRERVETFNSVSNQSTLNQNTAGRLGIFKDMYIVPEISTHDNTLDLNELWVGDSITVRLDNRITTINGQYRIEELSVTVDGNFAESVKLKLEQW